jgi:hypothetical protein
MSHLFGELLCAAGGCCHCYSHEGYTEPDTEECRATHEPGELLTCWCLGCVVEVRACEHVVVV